MSTERFQVNSPILQLPGLLNTTSLQLLQAESDPDLLLFSQTGILTFNKTVNRNRSTVVGLLTSASPIPGQQAVTQQSLPIITSSQLNAKQLAASYADLPANLQALQLNIVATDGSRLNTTISAASLFE